MRDKLSHFATSRQEYINYLGFIRKERRFYSAIRHLAKALRGGTGRLPDLYLRHLSGTSESQMPDPLPRPVSLSRAAPETEGLPVRLASKEALLAPSMIESGDFHFHFEDPEDLFSLHRFGWILAHLKEDDSKLPFLTDFVLSWISAHPAPDSANSANSANSEGWDSYSISERLVHWTYLLKRCELSKAQGGGRTGFIKQHMVRSLHHLSRSLEYHGNSTNNHLINNGRALYIAGSYLGDPCRDLGREILTYEAERQFTSSGFLREGSSHYQLLLTRSYLEVLKTAHDVEDVEFYENLEGAVSRMVGASAFFLKMDEMPLIGDVSPDVSPSFLVNSPSMAPVTSRTTASSANEVVHIHDPESGYFFFQNGTYSFYLYLNPSPHVPGGSHAHSDTGSFILYWKQKPFLVDCGRIHYRQTPLGRYGRSIRSHNGLSLDGHEPVVIQGLNGYTQLLQPQYFQRPPLLRFDGESNPAELTVTFFGFERWNPGATVARTFRFHPHSVEILDRVGGSGRHRLETFFHFHPSVDARTEEGGGLLLDSGSARLKLTADDPPFALWKGVEGKQPSGWFFPEYGKKVPTTTAVRLQNSALPLSNRYLIEGID